MFTRLSAAISLLFLCSGAISAQTTISDKLYASQGVTFSGRLQFTAKPSNVVTTSIVTAGVVSVSLAAGEFQVDYLQGATPGQDVCTEKWRITASATALTILQARGTSSVCTVKAASDYSVPPSSGGGGGATIPSTTNMLKGDGAGNGADAGFAPSAVVQTATGIPAGSCLPQSYTAGGTISQYQIVTLAGGTANAATTSTVSGYGIAQAAATIGNPVPVCSIGYSNVIGDGTLTAGDLAGVSSTTAGDVHDLAQTSRSSVGIATGIIGVVTTGCTGVACSGVVSLEGIARTGRQIPWSSLIGTLGTPIPLSGLSSPPSNPAPGVLSVYSDSVGALHTLTSGGINTTIGSNATNAYSPTIVAIGDSLTQGNEDNQGDTYPGYLQATSQRAVSNQGYSGQNTAQIAARFLNEPATWASYFVIWGGTNDIIQSVTLPTTLSNIASITTQLSPANRFVVLPPLNSTLQGSGTSGYTSTTAMSAAFASAYPSNYLDVRAALVAAYNPANPVDVVNHAANVPPYTLHAQLIAGGLPSALTDTVSCPTGFSVAAGSTMKVDSEYIFALTTGFATCTRGYASSTAATHSAAAAYTVIDGLHLNGAGYALVANAINTFINANDPLAGYKSQFFPSQGNEGNLCLYDLTCSLITTGYWDTAVGYQSQSAETTAINNVSLGYQTLINNVTGFANTAIGTRALRANTAGQNTAVGNYALLANTSGSSNNAFGASALTANTTGNYNFAGGVGSLQSNTIGSQNVGVGNNSLFSNTSGNSNTSIGFDAGWCASNANTTGGNNTYLGANTCNSTTTQRNFETVIGAGALGNCSNCIVVGRNGGTTSTSDVIFENATFTAASGTNQLPAASSYPQSCTWVSDGAASPSYLRTETGGGSLKLRVCSDGTNWQDH